MKTTFTLFALALTLSVSAQLTFTQSSFVNWTMGADTGLRLMPSGAYPEIASGANASWDFSQFTYDPGIEYYNVHKAFSDPAFPDASFRDSILYKINSTLSYVTQPVGALRPNGFFFYGQKLHRQAFSLTAITTGAFDSLVFLAQNIPYSTPESSLPFPVTAGSAWVSNFKFSTNFTITVQAYQLFNALCERKTHLVLTDSIVGWGKMRVKDRAGNLSNYMDVLMAKSYFVQADSFFLYGQPAPVALLSAFGLSQGQLINYYNYNFYRENEFSPLCHVEYYDNSFSTDKIKNIIIHVDRLDMATGIIDQKPIMQSRVFPNPVTGNSLNLELSDAKTTTYTYMLLSLSGQIIAQGTLQTDNGRATLYDFKPKQAGLYYLRLRETTNGKTETLPLSVL